MSEKIETDEEADKMESSDSESENERLRERVRTLEDDVESHNRTAGGGAQIIFLALIFGCFVIGFRFCGHTSWDESLIFGGISFLGILILLFCAWMWEDHKEIVIGIGVLLFLIGGIRSCWNALF